MKTLLIHIPLYILQVFSFVFTCLLYLVSWKKSVIYKNIDLTQLSKNYSQKKKFYFKLLQHLSYDLLSFVWFRLSPSIFHPKVVIDSGSRNHIQSILISSKKKKPTIIYSLHFSNFEWMAQILRKENIPLVASIHPLHQNFFSKVLQFLRKSNNQNYTSDLKNNFQRIRHIFNEGKVLGWMMDQRPPKSSQVQNPFLGKTTSWNPVPNYLENKFNTKNYGCYLFRHSLTKYYLNVFPLQNKYPDCFKEFEIVINKNPEYFYGFTHKRFSFETQY